MALDFDKSYSPLKNGSAENEMIGWTIDSIIASEKDHTNGDHCFVTTALPAMMRSEKISVLPHETIILSYQVKTDKEAAFTPQDSYIIVHIYGSDKEKEIFRYQFGLLPTPGQWQTCTQSFNTADNAYYLDIEFVIGKPNHSTNVFLDNIKLNREISYEPLYGPTKPMVNGGTVYTYRKGRRSNARQVIAVQSLQGTLARLVGPSIWIDAGDDTFIDYFKQRFELTVDESLQNDWAGLLKKFKDQCSGTYVLYDMYDKPSITAATTVAGLIDGVAIDVRLEDEAKRIGYTMAVDVREKDCRWVYDTYREQLNHDGIVVHTNDYRIHPSVEYLIDWPAATKQLCWWYPDEKLSREVYRSMAPVSPVYGWQDPVSKDEGITVKIHSEEGLFQMPSDWMLNLSFHAATGPAMKDKTFKQKVIRKEPAKEDDVHYVTFVMSDMDNILTEIGTNSFYSGRKYFDNKHRGEFPMTWGMAPSLTELSRAGMEMWYDAATEEDAFVGYCGLGYFYPNWAPYLQTHMQRLQEFINRADLKVMLLIDRVLPERKFSGEYYAPFAKRFMDIESLRGLFYMEYVEYAPHGGKIYWYDGKPMVTARFDFRTETFYSAVRPTAEKLAATLNSLPRNPRKAESYSMVTVHAWSKGMDDVYETIQLLDENVRVVNGEEFIELLHKNIPESEREAY